MSNSRDVFESALNAEKVTGPLADLARSIFMQESGGGRNTKTSNAGARGGMQIIPGTFAQVADKSWSIDDPEHNARAGIRYLQKLDKQAGGDPALTAAGYYGGPGGLEKARRGVAVSDPRNPQAPNTLQYGQQVVARMPGSNAVATVSPPAASASPPAIQEAVVAQVSSPPPVQGSGLVDLPPELLAHRAGATQAAPQADAWAQFLKTMPASGQQVAVQPADLSYGMKPVAIQAPSMGRAPSNVTPNFAAFQAWGGKRA